MIKISISKNKEKSRNIKLLAFTLSIAMILFFAFMVSAITRYFPEEIIFLGHPMNFHYFVFGLFVLFFGIIGGFIISKIRKANRIMKKKGY